MTASISAYADPPEILRVGDEVILRSLAGDACYTLDAVRRLHADLGRLLDAVASAGDG